MSGQAIREAVGFFGVVASLLFVGLEIRQNTAATRGQTRQELAALNQEWLMLLTADPGFSELWERAWVARGPVAPEEEFRVDMMMALHVRRLENVYFQYREGLVDESALGSYGFQAPIFDDPRFQAWWIDDDWRGSFHPDFVTFLELRAQ